MRKFAQPLSLLAGICLVALHASPARALGQTWVAYFGDDENPCDASTPCKTFAGAYAKTDVGGEISCLFSGNYGAVSITNSITINCEGAIGSNAAGGSIIGSVSIFG